LITMTKQVSVAGIMADPDYRPGHNYGHGEVNTAVARTLHDMMQGKQPLNFIKPSDRLAYGQRSGVPNVKCQPVDAASNALKGAGFQVNVDPGPVDSDCPAGTVARTAPSGAAPKGSIITIYVSKGGGPGPGPGP